MDTSEIEGHWQYKLGPVHFQIQIEYGEFRERYLKINGEWSSWDKWSSQGIETIAYLMGVEGATEVKDPLNGTWEYQLGSNLWQTKFSDGMLSHRFIDPKTDRWCPWSDRTEYDWETEESFLFRPMRPLLRFVEEDDMEEDFYNGVFEYTIISDFRIEVVEGQVVAIACVTSNNKVSYLDESNPVEEYYDVLKDPNNGAKRVGDSFATMPEYVTEETPYEEGKVYRVKFLGLSEYLFQIKVIGGEFYEYSPFTTTWLKTRDLASVLDGSDPNFQLIDDEVPKRAPTIREQLDSKGISETTRWIDLSTKKCYKVMEDSSVEIREFGSDHYRKALFIYAEDFLPDDNPFVKIHQ